MKNHGLQVAELSRLRAKYKRASHFYMLRRIYLQLGLPILFIMRTSKNDFFGF